MRLVCVPLLVVLGCFALAQEHYPRPARNRVLMAADTPNGSQILTFKLSESTKSINGQALLETWTLKGVYAASVGTTPIKGMKPGVVYFSNLNDPDALTEVGRVEAGGSKLRFILKNLKWDRMLRSQLRRIRKPQLAKDPMSIFWSHDIESLQQSGYVADFNWYNEVVERSRPMIEQVFFPETHDRIEVALRQNGHPMKGQAIIEVWKKGEGVYVVSVGSVPIPGLDPKMFYYARRNDPTMLEPAGKIERDERDPRRLIIKILFEQETRVNAVYTVLRHKWDVGPNAPKYTIWGSHDEEWAMGPGVYGLQTLGGPWDIPEDQQAPYASSD